jgi:hypothetical protein
MVPDKKLSNVIYRYKPFPVRYTTIIKAGNMYLHAKPGDNSYIAERERFVEGLFKLALLQES